MNDNKEILMNKMKKNGELDLPPFMKDLYEYVQNKPASFATPGHFSGRFYQQHPAGKALLELLGEKIFVADISSSDVALGDPLIHDEPSLSAEQYAAKVFNADFTYFVLNGTSTANKIVAQALLCPGDVVLFDRNNHKSLYQGCLEMTEALPLFLPCERNKMGIIGGLDTEYFNEEYIRTKLKNIAPDKANKSRPIRLAVLQQNTNDGLIYNVDEVLRRIGHLCEYILFDAAWLGYEQCIDFLAKYSPLQRSYSSEDPGIIVTQSVHKQLAGFSQTSQIHKKDEHIKDKPWYCTHDIFNNAFMLLSSTSPFYPMIASIAVNAKMHDGQAGKDMWIQTIQEVENLRLQITKKCKYIKVFQNYADDDIYKIKDKSLQNLEMYILDPAKIIITTYQSKGIPACILNKYLEEKGIICEKSDMYALLFLFTPGFDKTIINKFIETLIEFENDYDNNTLLTISMPKLSLKDKMYQNMGLRDLADKMHEFYKKSKANILLQKLFSLNYIPKEHMSMRKASIEFKLKSYEKIPINKALNKTTLEALIPYPPGIVLVNAGEILNQEAVNYLLFLDELANNFTGFDMEVQGLHIEIENEKRRSYLYAYKVLEF